MIEGPSSVDKMPTLTRPNEDRVGHFGLTQDMARGYRCGKKAEGGRRKSEGELELQICNSDFFCFRLPSSVSRLTRNTGFASTWAGTVRISTSHFL